MVCFALEPKAAAEAIRLATSTGWSSGWDQMLLHKRNTTDFVVRA